MPEQKTSSRTCGQLLHCLKIQFWVRMGTQDEENPRNTIFTNTHVHNHLHTYIHKHN